MGSQYIYIYLDLLMVVSLSVNVVYVFPQKHKFHEWNLISDSEEGTELHETNYCR